MLSLCLVVLCGKCQRGAGSSVRWRVPHGWESRGCSGTVASLETAALRQAGAKPRCFKEALPKS